MKFISSIRFVFPSAIIATVAALPAQTVDYSSIGAAYNQNFNSLASAGTGVSWSNGTTLSGWYFVNTSGSSVSSYNTRNGSSSDQGSLLSLGADSNSDRAFGAQSPSLGGSGSNVMRYGLALVNNTGSTLTDFSLSYVGEQWRVVSSDSADTVTFDYQVFGSGSGSLTAASGWTEVSNLDYTSPIVGVSTGPLDGYNAANQDSVSGSVSSISWAVGQELWIRWSDHNDRPSNPDPEQRMMLGIDDVSFSATAIPEPGTMALLMSVLTLGLAMRFRRK